MALMRYREPNQVTYVGVRPGHDGTQFTRFNGIENDTIMLYSAAGVTVAEIAYIHLSVITGVNAGLGSIQLWNAVPALVDSVMMIQLPANAYNQVATGLPYPLELLEDWSLRIYSAVAELIARAMVFGWSE